MLFRGNSNSWAGRPLLAKFFFATLLLANIAGADAQTLPSEEVPQECIYLAFGVQASVWGSNMVVPVQQALARIANAAASYQPVRILVPSTSAQSTIESLISPSVSVNVSYETIGLNDIWARDIFPVFVKDASGERQAVGLNFNGWGGKQVHNLDTLVAEQGAASLDMNFIKAGIIGEGGGIETDGEGTAIMTESSWINPNRNPGKTKEDIEIELGRLLGIEKVIWLPGIRGKDITDAHVDFYARFVKPGVVIANLEMEKTSYDYALTRTHISILKAATDAKGRPLTITTISTPTTFRPDYSNSPGFAPGYINYVVLNGAILLPQFGDAQADAAALAVLENSFPSRKVIQLNIDAIAAGGGGIHCVTMNLPL